MAKESIAQALAVMGPFNQAGNIRDDQGRNGFVSRFQQSKTGLQGGEGVVRDLGTRSRHAGNEGALAGIGQSQKADVGQKAEFEKERASLPFSSLFRPLGSLIPGIGEAGVSLASPTPLGHQAFRPRNIQVGEKKTGLAVQNAGSDWNIHHNGFSLGSGTLVAAPLSTVDGIGGIPARHPEKGMLMLHRSNDHVAAVAAVAPVRSPLGHELLPAKGPASVPAAAATNLESRVVLEKGFPAHGASVPASRGAPWTSALGGDHRDSSAALELDHAVFQGEEGEILPHAHSTARMKTGSTLADEDVASLNGLPTVALHAPHLGVGVAPVSGRTATFLMGHGFESAPNLLDSDVGVGLTMAGAGSTVLSPPEAEDVNLLVLDLAQDFRDHGSALDGGPTHENLAILLLEKLDLVEDMLAPLGCAGEKINPEVLSLLEGEASGAVVDDCVHGRSGANRTRQFTGEASTQQGLRAPP